MKKKEKAVQLLEQLNCKLDTIIGLLENKTIEKISITDFSDDKQQLAVEVSLKVKNVFEHFLYPATERTMNRWLKMNR